MKRKALGRGLSALIPEQPKPAATSTAQPVIAATDGQREFFSCSLTEIRPDPRQPRQSFDQKKLDELVQSLREVGMVQPLVVRKSSDGYILIAGERRWRAAQRAGMHRVPVVVKDVDDLQAFELALVENLQRADLNPIEEAEAYQRLLDDHGYSQTQLAERIGKDRSTLTNALRLAKLPQDVQKALISGEISPGHGRALLALPSSGEMIRVMREIVKKELSVRQTEVLVKRPNQESDHQSRNKGVQLSANAKDLQDRLGQSLKTKVRLIPRGQRGRIEVHYGSLDELDRLLKVFIS